MMLMGVMSSCTMKVKLKRVPLILIIVVLTAINIKLFFELNEKSLIIDELNDRISALRDEYDKLISEYEMFLYMVNLTYTGATIQSLCSLRFFKISEKEVSYNAHAIIYNPKENSILNLFLSDIFPENKYMYLYLFSWDMQRKGRKQLKYGAMFTGLPQYSGA